MKKTLQKLFPQKVDNTYKGAKIALYAFYLLLAITLGRSLVHIFAPDGGAQSIATFPLDTFSENAANAVILVFALWGLSQLIVGIMYVIVAVKYRSLVPLMYLLFVVEYIGRTAIGHFKPVILVGTAPGGAMNIPMIVVGISMFLLSLLEPKKK